jgi:hypothetical protein
LFWLFRFLNLNAFSMITKLGNLNVWMEFETKS